MRAFHRTTTPLFVALFLAACGTATTEVPAEKNDVVACETSDDCTNGQVCVAGLCRPPEEAPVDAGTAPVDAGAPRGTNKICSPCDTDATCGGSGVCVFDEGLREGSCGVTCATNADCPRTMACSNLTKVGGGTTRACFPATRTCDALDPNSGTTHDAGTTSSGETGGSGGTDSGEIDAGTAEPPIDADAGTTEPDPIDAGTTTTTTTPICTPCAATSECSGGICFRDQVLAAGACGPRCTADADCDTGARCVAIGSSGAKGCVPTTNTCDGWGGSTTGGGTTSLFCSECTADADCGDGMCLADSTLGIGMCGTTCVDVSDCETGATCEDIYSARGRYLGSNCFPASGTCSGWGTTGGGGSSGANATAAARYMCDYCETDYDCGSNGYCLWDDYYYEGACGSPCATNADCPTGTTCGEHEVSDLFSSDTVRSCFPSTNTCRYY